MKFESMTKSIGENCVLEGVTINAEFIVIGNNVRLCPGTVIEARRVEIGDETRGLGPFVAGGGGKSDPESAFIVGKECQIGEDVFINTARSFTMCDRSAIAMRSIVLTHGFWRSPLEGYPVEYAPVTPAEDAWVKI